MYIGEVLRRCDMLCPNEYSEYEKYKWCDELSAMLMNEHNKKYEKVTLSPLSDGSYVLPEGITFEMVDRIIVDGKEVDKLDFRSYGIEYLYGTDSRFTLPEKHRASGDVDVVYLKQHEPIRNVVVSGNDVKEVISEKGVIIDRPMFRVGDMVSIAMSDGRVEETMVTGMATKYLTTHGTIYTCTFPEKVVFFAREVFNVSGQATINNIKRIVTEQTVCPAPYDRMYIDYVMAQICYYQRNFSVYNQHMNLFNQRLLAYQSWLQQRRVQDKDGKFVNWW